MEFLLNTIRMVDYDQVRELSFGDEDSLKEKLAIGIINPEDLKKLNLSPNSNIKVSSEFGEVVLKVKEDKDLPHGVIIVPVSIWANQITGIEKNKLLYKNLRANVVPTNDPVQGFKNLINNLKGK